MRKLILSAAVALIALGIHGHARAAEAPAACQTPADLVAKVQASASDDFTISMLGDFRGEAAKVLIDFYNAQPPQSDFVADEAVILHAVAKSTGAEHPGWVLAIFKDGCKVEAGLFPSAVIKQIMGSSI